MGIRGTAVATGLGVRQYLRNSLFVVLLVLLPPSFITLSFIVTPEVPAIVSVPEGERTLTPDVGMVNLHGAVMVPITAAFLSGLLGMFVMLSSRGADRRLVSAGYPLGQLLAVRLGIIGALSAAITLIAVGVTLLDYRPQQLQWFLVVNLVSALQYAFLGALVGTFLSAMSGTYLMFFAPMIDVGLVQNPMFPRDSVAWWVQVLPGYAPMEVLLDVSFSERFDSAGALGVALAYLAGLSLLGLIAFWRVTAPRGGRRAETVRVADAGET
jgi:hypothetical protein